MIFANTKSGIGGKVVTAALLVLFFAASSAVVTSAADIYVPAGENQNIQQAVNNASTGDTIIVRDGTYNENVYVNVTDLIIRSENGSGNCIVNAKYENTDVFFVAANYVTITGFTVQGATEFGYAGICLFGAGYCYISDNNVLNNGDGISILDSGYNLVANNIVTGNNYTGIYMELANANIVLGNTATNNGWEGIFIASSYNNTFIRNNASNNTIYEFYSDEYSQNNTVKDLQLCNNQTSVSFTYGNGAGLKCVDTVPTEPSEKRGISKYVETIEVCADSWLFLNMSYEEADLGCVAEDSLSMWEHSGTDWVEVAGTTGVNTAKNYVYANITEFNILAPLGDTNGVSLEPLGSSNGLNCTFGDLCVNESGWWHDNGTFNASTTQQIQLAINNASEGDTVYVYNGSYTENVNVSKRLTLEGEGAEVVTVTNSTADHHVFEVTEDLVNISGFNVTGATGTTGTCKAGIHLYDRQHCNIYDNIASGNYNGIYLGSSSNNTLSSNNASNNNCGINLYFSSNNTLSGNAASNNEHGIQLWSSSNNTLSSNNAYSNSFNGILLLSSSNNMLSNNNASDSGHGIYLQSSSNNNTLLNNTAYSNIQDGIELYDSSNNTLSNNTAYSNSGYGIQLYDSCNNNTLSNNTVKLNSDGIYLENADDNNITCNWVHGNTHAGFNLTGGSTGNNISCNNIVANGVPNGTAWEWQFYNNQEEAVEAKNNYWGAGMDNATIEASIYDWQDDPANCGNVTYNPFEENPNICAPIPELSTVILLGIGLLLLAGYLRIRRKR